MTVKIDKIVRSSRRTLALVVSERGEIIARAPWLMKERVIIEFVEKNKDWIDRRKHLVEKRKNILKPKSFVEGEEFFYLGRKYPLKIAGGSQIGLLDCLEFPSQFIFEAKERLLRWYSHQALVIIRQRAGIYAALAGVVSPTIKITHSRKRWGSCGVRNNLNFTWRLIMAPLEIVDYVAVHELMHIKEKNHSARFWKQVERYCPFYKERRKWLRDNGHILMSEMVL